MFCVGEGEPRRMCCAVESEPDEPAHVIPVKYSNRSVPLNIIRTIVTPRTSGALLHILPSMQMLASCADE
jgi:hypothetical protein